MPITLRNVSFSYAGKGVLSHLNWSLAEGRHYCLSGASGLGKTTLFRLLMGLEQPKSGSIDGLSNLRVSAVFQEDRLCENLSAWNNVRLVCSSDDECARGRGLFDELGIAETLHQPARELSGGMKRRLALARALTIGFDLLLLDEPLTGLDAQTRSQTCAVIERYAAGKTAVMVHHGSFEDAAAWIQVDLNALQSIPHHE